MTVERGNLGFSRRSLSGVHFPEGPRERTWLDFAPRGGLRVGGTPTSVPHFFRVLGEGRMFGISVSVTWAAALMLSQGLDSSPKPLSTFPVSAGVRYVEKTVLVPQWTTER